MSRREYYYSLPDIAAVVPSSPAETEASELDWRRSKVSISALARGHHLGTQWRTAIVTRRACRKSCRECCRADKKGAATTRGEDKMCGRQRRCSGWPRQKRFPNLTKMTEDCGVGLRERRGPSGAASVGRGQETRPAERAIESRSLVLDEKALGGEFQDFTLKRGEGRPPQGRIAQWVHAAECNLADIEGRVCPARAALGHAGRAPFLLAEERAPLIPEAEPAPPGGIIAAASISVTPRRRAATLSPVRYIPALRTRHAGKPCSSAAIYGRKGELGIAICVHSPRRSRRIVDTLATSQVDRIRTGREYSGSINSPSAPSISGPTPESAEDACERSLRRSAAPFSELRNSNVSLMLKRSLRASPHNGTSDSNQSKPPQPLRTAARVRGSLDGGDTQCPPFIFQRRSRGPSAEGWQAGLGRGLVLAWAAQGPGTEIRMRAQCFPKASICRSRSRRVTAVRNSLHSFLPHPATAS
ncbi:hypothetical protein HPB50_026567 [Hyalomma asiaticum]|uniref:Uncharacterized protein n=1 Tax=Hyalomma asiaticum TaxID=266040 RepID=A0ACB7TRR4_HYAAI|nr:hypothetical protein HPB50_026567 [Hyalomma asiaticum]